MNKYDKQVFEMLTGMCLLAIATITLFIAPALFTAEYATIILVVAIAFAVFGFITLYHALYDLRLKIPSKLHQFKQDKRGIAWIWVVAGLTLCFMPFVYWGMGLALDQLLLWVDANYVFTGTMASAYTLGKTIIQFLSVFCLFGVLLWSIINAKTSAYGG